MSKKTIKEKLYKLIEEIEDEQALNMLMEDAAYYSAASKRDILDDLTPEQLKELDEAIAEADRGETMTLEEFKKETARWRTKS